MGDALYRRFVAEIDNEPVRFGQRSVINLTQGTTVSEIVSVAAGVAYLKAIASDGEGRAIRQVGEGASNWIGRSIADRSKNSAVREPFVSHRFEVKLSAAFDGHSCGNHLIGAGVPRVELVSVGAIGFEDQCALKCECGGLARSDARSQDRCAAASAHCDQACDDAFTAQSAGGTVVVLETPNVATSVVLLGDGLWRPILRGVPIVARRV